MISGSRPAMRRAASKKRNTAWMAAIGCCWRPLAGISDSKTESYEFTVRGLSPGEHTIAVRAYDKFENVGAAKNHDHGREIRIIRALSRDAILSVIQTAQHLSF